MEFSFKRVQRAQEEIDPIFKSHIKNIPMYINVNGLVPTIAFIMSKINKKDKENKEVKSYRYIGTILIEYFYSYGLLSPKAQEKLDFDDRKDIIKQLGIITDDLLSQNTTNYRRCTLEIISMLEWTVKFADGMIEASQDNAEAVDEGDKDE